MRLIGWFGICLTLLIGLTGCGAMSNSLSGTTPPVPQQVAQSAQSEASATHRVANTSGCGTRAIFVRLDTEIRGYPIDASGVITPCVVISGQHSQLVERGALAISTHGYLHSLSFQSDYGLTIHRSYAAGDAAPSRIVRVNQDHVALAVDSHVNDFVVASEFYEGDNCWYVVADKQTQAGTQNCDPNLSAIHALAVDNRDELIAVGIDASSRASRIDVFSGPATAAPRLVRSITGPTTGLPALRGSQGYFDVSFSLATDPRSGDLYVFSHLYNSLGGGAIPGAPPASVAEFGANATGNVAPQRVIRGPNAHLASDAFAVNILGTDDRGNLFAFSPAASPVVSVFGPNASENAIPDRSFSDPTAKIGFSGAALAVRTVTQ